KKISARIISIYDASDRLTQVGETYKQKAKGGTLVTKRTTVYDPATGEVISQKNKTKFEKSGFFNSTAGKILGIAAIVALTIISAGILGPALIAAGGIFSASIAGVTVGAAVAAGIGAGVGQFALSLAQGADFKDALIAGAISFAAATGAAFLGPLVSNALGQIPGIGTALNSLKTGLSNIGKSFSGLFGATGSKVAEQTFFQNFLNQFSLRAGSEVFSETFGKKLGAFGTVAALAVAGTLLSSVLSNALGSSLTSGQFADNFANSIFSGSIQGGIAEALKGEKGLGAQFLREFGSNFAGNLKLSGIAAAYSTKQALGIAKTLAEQEGISIDQIKDVAVFEDAKVGVLYQKDDVTKYALLGYEKDKFYVLTQEVIRSSFELGKDILLAYSDYQKYPRGNLIVVGGAGEGQLLAAARDIQVERTDYNVTFGDPNYFALEADLAWAAKAFPAYDSNLRKEFIENFKASGYVLDEAFSTVLPQIYKTILYEKQYFTGQFDNDNLPIIERINPTIETVVYNQSALAAFATPGNPVALADALQSRFRNQDVNIVAGFSYGAATSLEAARILNERGVQIDYLVLVDPSTQDLRIPPNVKNVKLYYQDTNTALNFYLGKPDNIVTDSATTRVFDPIRINVSHTVIDGRQSIREDLQSFYSNQLELKTRQQLFLDNYGSYIKNLFNGDN
ncbi:hypothetical protein HY612_04575, partial [Candidatus Roizmanbacteria bacterium]|nr:hypothetical protein [Candidatus Roizmanbacteria bacterium]